MDYIVLTLAISDQLQELTVLGGIFFDLDAYGVATRQQHEKIASFSLEKLFISANCLRYGFFQNISPFLIALIDDKIPV